MPSTHLGVGVAQLLRMSKNNNPQTRPGFVRRRRPKTPSPATTPAVAVKQSKLRRFLPTILIPHGVAVLLVVVAAVAALMFSAASMVALPATIAQLWLALNMSAVSGSGEVVSVIPMVPAMVLVWTVARRVHKSVRKRVSIADLAVLAALVLAIPLSLTGIASAMLYDASGVLDVDVPPVPVMLGRVLLLHASALFLGMGPRLWRALARRYGAPEWFVDSITLAIRFLVTYAVVACVGILIMLAVNHQAFVETLSGYGEASAVPALLILSLLYLPNMIVYTMGVLVGAPLYFGDAIISLFNVSMVPLPPLPVLAAIPASATQWAVIGLLIPATVAAWVSIKNPMRLIVTLASGLFGALFFLVLALLAGGRLGVYGYVGLNLLPAVGLMFGYLVIVGALIAGIDRLRSSAKTPTPAGAGQELVEDQPVTEPDAQSENPETSGGETVVTASQEAQEASEEEPVQDSAEEENAEESEEEPAVYIEAEEDGDIDTDPAAETEAETSTESDEESDAEEAEEAQGQDSSAVDEGPAGAPEADADADTEADSGVAGDVKNNPETTVDETNGGSRADGR